MALVFNIRTSLNRIILNDFRFMNRFYCDPPDNEKENQKVIPPEKDRTKIIPVETSIRYLKSKAYKTTYEDKPVWFFYRRNHKGGMAPKKTRLKCIRKGIISTGNPCPICRDEYLIIDPRNTGLIKQFICEHTGKVMEPFDTGVCQHKHRELLVAIKKAYDQGYLTYDVQFRHYDYSLYDKSKNYSADEAI